MKSKLILGVMLLNFFNVSAMNIQKNNNVTRKNAVCFLKTYDDRIFNKYAEEQEDSEFDSSIFTNDREREQSLHQPTCDDLEWLNACSTQDWL